MGQIVGYADDICLLGRSLSSLRKMYQDLRKNPKEVGLEINVNNNHSYISNRVDQHLEIIVLRW
jgi:hypothetical protein